MRKFTLLNLCVPYADRDGNQSSLKNNRLLLSREGVLPNIFEAIAKYRLRGIIMIRGESPSSLKLVLFASSFTHTVIFAVIFGGHFQNQIKTASFKMKDYERNSS